VTWISLNIYLTTGYLEEIPVKFNLNTDTPKLKGGVHRINVHCPIVTVNDDMLLV
jgi:hypothetical protein